MVKGFPTVKEAAERLAVSETRIRQMILDGVISGTQKAGTVILIPEKEVARLENTERKAGRPAKVKKDEKPK